MQGKTTNSTQGGLTLLEVASIIIRGLSCFISLAFCANSALYGAASGILMGIALVPIIGMLLISTAISLKSSKIITEYKFLEKCWQFYTAFIWRQPINYSCATMSVLLFYSLGFTLGFIQSNSLDIVAGIGAVGGVVDCLLFSVYRLVSEKSKGAGYCIAYTLGVAAFSSAALVSVHLMTSSIITGMGLELGVEESGLAYLGIAIVTFFIIPICALFLEKTLDYIYSNPLKVNDPG